MPSGTNRIIIVPGANREVRPDVAAEAVDAFRPDVVIGQFEIPQGTTAAGFAAARRIGAATVLNPAPAASVEPQLLEVTDWLVPNGPEFELIAGQPLDGSPDEEVARVRALAERLGVSMVVTLGERGALVLPRGGEASLVEARAGPRRSTRRGPATHSSGRSRWAWRGPLAGRRGAAGVRRGRGQRDPARDPGVLRRPGMRPRRSWPARPR